jgi:RND superfamily putative drug exporter
MFEAWGRFVYRRRRLVLLVAAMVMVGAAVWGTGVFGALQSGGGFTAPGSQSERASAVATRAFGRDTADVVVLYRSPALTVRDPAYRAAVTGSLSALPKDKVLSYQTYWSTGSPLFAGARGHETYAVLRLAGSDDGAQMKTYQAISGELGVPGVTTHVGGQIPTELTINDQVKDDIGRAEGISMPVLLILLLVIFGSLAAAGLPLAIGAVGIIGSFAALRLLTLVTDVSIYSINITTILGLGLAIDYGLFMTARFREELRSRPSVEDALARTVATRSRTLSPCPASPSRSPGLPLMLFPDVPALHGLRRRGDRRGGHAGRATVMPALLAVLGYRVNALRIQRRPEGALSLARTAAGGALVPHRPQRHAPPGRLRGRDRRVLLALGSRSAPSPGAAPTPARPARGAGPRVVQEALASDFRQRPTPSRRWSSSPACGGPRRSRPPW